jgi:large subunit ribosomal protein L29
MATMKKKDIRKLDEKEAKKKLGELRLELSKERAKIRIGASVTSPGQIKQIRRNIARILTIGKETSKAREEKKTNG